MKEIYGIQAASQYYYHIDAIDLNKQQSDILVKTLKRPSVYNPSKSELKRQQLSCLFF